MTLEAAIFGVLATFALRRFSHYGLVAFAIGWMALLVTYFVPAPEVSFPGVEGTPVSNLIGTACGIVAASACLAFHGRQETGYVRMLMAVGMYTVVTVPIRLVGAFAAGAV